jgi:hypothetical protein
MVQADGKAYSAARPWGGARRQHPQQPSGSGHERLCHSCLVKMQGANSEGTGARQDSSLPSFAWCTSGAGIGEQRTQFRRHVRDAASIIPEQVEQVVGVLVFPPEVEGERLEGHKGSRTADAYFPLGGFTRDRVAAQGDVSVVAKREVQAGSDDGRPIFGEREQTPLLGMSVLAQEFSAQPLSCLGRPFGMVFQIQIRLHRMHEPDALAFRRAVKHPSVVRHDQPHILAA